ncbi:hypothetical protein BURC_00992 [Burkholderiaceae bacterium]|nr:hypothetical protein BURC_00992 [Burkholderiaceae bacterium]
MKNLAKTAIALAALAVSATASAVTISSYTFDGGAVQINFQGDPRTLAAGEISVVSDVGSFATYCMELTQGVGTPPISGYAFGPYVNDWMSRLVSASGFYGGVSPGNEVDTTLEKTAFQLAIWEAVYDAFPGDLSAGDFSVTSAGAGVLAQANSYLSAAAGLTAGTYPGNSLLAFTHPSRQDLVTSIPEPSTYMLMLAGLAGVGFVARRRSGGRS